MRMPRCTGRVFRSFRFLRVVAVVMSDCLGSVCFRMMIVAAQELEAATRSRQQPNHDTACRYNAEADMDIWLPRNHTLNSLFIAPCRGGLAAIYTDADPDCAQKWAGSLWGITRMVDPPPTLARSIQSYAIELL